jgi:ABC-2 type transport system ATP-binding protein
VTAVVHLDGMRIATRARSIGPFHLEVAGGETVGLVGPNGSGKTTLLRLALGLDWATAGSCRIFGRLVDPWHPPVGVGVVFEADGWYPWLSGRDNLAIYGDVHCVGTLEVLGLLDEVGLTPAADQAVRNYSRGMRQRLAIARARLGDPALLVLDEPTVALDADASEWLQRVVADHVDAGGAALVASHEQDFLDALDARYVAVDQGRCG